MILSVGDMLTSVPQSMASSGPPLHFRHDAQWQASIVGLTILTAILTA
ncbi:hypothetical protein GPLA_2937 [Paraglaciecola polaris LMG 21857]|uniref:Uncharacterized protein n=1 Tax=Paraglaciecola polaris LMG 21857 TaxID=1129793 RepID=K7AEX0_9ALTE|nr:hypothetical protein GPLA_2937 [Paraglaciecola polaris LMG 21857]